jgi:hypothetical protein
MHFAHQFKILRALELLDQLSALLLAIEIEHDGGHMLDVRIDGVTEQQQLQQRYGEDKARRRVALDMDNLFFEDRP